MEQTTAKIWAAVLICSAVVVSLFCCESNPQEEKGEGNEREPEAAGGCCAGDNSGELHHREVSHQNGVAEKASPKSPETATP